ncbi:MAG: carboxypeptidase-like regulatory domain-containing protein [Candidatus Micrarchaeota archaeon]|nr:carboxypeptidase-like regulatory domain-containing protein [Candidatus Micrarchaeota archaeon]
MSSRQLFVFALLLLLFCGILSAAFTEWLVVQVFDHSYSVVEGAEVYAQFQNNAVAGTMKSKPVKTNSSGEAAFHFTNYEPLESSTEYSYTLYVKYGNFTTSNGLIAGNTTAATPRRYSFEIDAYYINAKVVDQNLKPLNATVTIDSLSFTNFEASADTDSSGRVTFRVPIGTYNIRAESEVFSKSETVDVNSGTGNVAVELKVPQYTLQINVMDDHQKPLVAHVEIGEMQTQTGANGSVLIKNIGEVLPSVKITYMNQIKKLKPQLDRQALVEVVFDRTPPIIKDVYATVSKSGSGTITLFAEDNGIRASGVDTVTVVWEVNGVRIPVQTYAVGYNSFEAKIPPQAQGTVVKYVITVTDKEGNSETKAGSYAVPMDSTQEPPQPKPQTGLFGGITIEAIAMGVFAFVIAAYAAVYYINKKKEEQEAEESSPYKQPPPEPPKI